MIRKIGRFIDPLTDFGFKLLFGSEPNKNILIAFLNHLFAGQKKLGYKFLELPNFVKTEAELETDLDKWFFLLKHMSHLDKIPAVLNKRIFQQLFKIAEISNLTKEERDMYDSSLKSKWDYENSITFAEEQAEERGVGRGREEEKIEMITNLIIQIGLSDEQIAGVANVSANFVKQIREGLKR